MKRSLKKIIIASILMTLFSTLFANGLDNKNNIGMYFIGADNPIVGLQYERRFTDIISEKFGLYAFYNENSYTTEPFNFNVTFETDFSLFETSHEYKVGSRLFAYGMVGYDLSMHREYADYSNSKNKDNTEEWLHNALVSIGFGFDFIFFNHLSVPIQFGFMGNFPNNSKISFCGGTALRYSW